MCSDYDVVWCQNRQTGEFVIYQTADDVPDAIMDNDTEWNILMVSFGDLETEPRR